MCLAATSNCSNQTIIAAAIPKITEDFPGVNLIGWYSSAFFISLACTQPFWYGFAHRYFCTLRWVSCCADWKSIGARCTPSSPSNTPSS